VSRLSRSLKVIETDTDRSATYDFLLVFHSNLTINSSRKVSEIKGDVCKIFPLPLFLPIYTTGSPFHTPWTNFVSHLTRTGPPDFNISVAMLQTPGAFPAYSLQLQLQPHQGTSQGTVGVLNCILCCLLSSSEVGAGEALRSCEKCSFQGLSLFSQSLRSEPSLAWMRLDTFTAEQRKLAVHF